VQVTNGPLIEVGLHTFGKEAADAKRGKKENARTAVTNKVFFIEIFLVIPSFKRNPL
jgi:hypothetical protein